MLSTIQKFLDSKKWKYKRIEDKNVIHFGINASNGNIDCVAEVREEHKQFIFLSYCTIKAIDEKLNSINEYLSRVNYNLVIGDFEINFEDGKIRFKSSMFYDDLFPISEKLVEQNIITNLYMVDRYLPGIMSVMYSGISPEQAHREIDAFPGYNFN